MRTVIVGNSGSGKTWLAARLGDRHAVPVVHLDDIFWMPGGFDLKRAPTDVAALVQAYRGQPRWIVEGVFGKLAAQFLPDALAFIWLDLPWDVCRNRLLSRGSQSKAHMTRQQSDEGLRTLMDWASGYEANPGSGGRAAHQALFDAFDGPRFQLRSETEVRAFVDAA